MIQPPNNTSLVDWLEGKLAFDFCLHYHACQIAAIPQSLHVNTPFSTFNPRVSNFPSFQKRKCDRANRYNYWVVGCNGLCLPRSTCLDARGTAKRFCHGTHTGSF